MQAEPLNVEALTSGSILGLDFHSRGRMALRGAPCLGSWKLPETTQTCLLLNLPTI